MERTKYEENKAVRHTSVVNSTASVLRSTHQEPAKSQLSPGLYEDNNARRTPVNYSTNPVSRGSPMLGRGSEGTIIILFQNCGFITIRHYYPDTTIKHLGKMEFELSCQVIILASISILALMCNHWMNIYTCLVFCDIYTVTRCHQVSTNQMSHDLSC